MSKNELKVSGKVVDLLDLQTGTGAKGTWKKREFVIETNDQYPKKICFAAWGDKADSIAQLRKGDNLTVSFNPESREYAGKWYTELKAWKIEGFTQASVEKDETNFGQEDDSETLPF